MRFPGLSSLIIVFLLRIALPQADTGILTGRVVAMDGMPESGVRVAVVAATPVSDPTAASTVLVSQAQTDSLGRYRLDRIPPGMYFVVAGPLESPSYYPGTPLRAKAAALSVTAGTTASAADFTLVRFGGIQFVRTAAIAGELSGSVYDGTNLPIQNVTIILTSGLTSGAQTMDRFMTTTNQLGAFKISGLSAGEYSIEVLSPVRSGYKSQGYEYVKHPVTIGPDQGLEIGVQLRLAMNKAYQQQRPDLYGPIMELGGVTISANALTLDSGELLLDPRTVGSRQGEIDLEVSFSNSGRVDSIRVVDPLSDPELARTAVGQARQWNLARVPNLRGEPIAVRSTVALYPARR